MDSIVIIGSGGHAKVILDMVERQGLFRVEGLADSDREPGEMVFGYRVLGPLEDMPALLRRYPVIGGLVAVGDNAARRLVAERLARDVPELRFVTAVHPTAAVARGAVLGPGAVVMAQAAVNSDARVGAHCILNTGSSLDHDCLMADYSSLAPGAAVGGNVRIGTCSAVSIGASVIHGLSIGAHTVVGAGAVVLRDLPDLCVAHGAPARVIRSRTEGEPYLSRRA